MKRELAALALLAIGIVFLVVGVLAAVYERPGLEQGFYTVKAGGILELSWYLEKGERTEGFFNVTGGNGQLNLIVKNPSQAVIANWTANGRFDGGFTAQETGTYTMIFRNLDSTDDQIVYVSFQSPYHRVRIYPFAGLLQ